MTLVRWTQGFSTDPLLQGSVLTIGNFDGLHRGHQHIVSATLARASVVGLPSVALTFDPHPSVVLSPSRTAYTLMTLDEKLRMLDCLGIHYGWALPFTSSLAEMPAQDFMQALVTSLRPESIHVGEGFRFGHRREGTSDFMLQWGRDHGLRVVTYPLQHFDGEPISSSRIRTLLREGKITNAAQLLGRPYSISGTVIEGFKRGHRLGFPTANLQTDGRLLPQSGVYITSVHSALWEGQRLGLTNVGVQPTFQQGSLTVETHCPEGAGDWYGALLTLDFLHRLRDEQTFSSPEALVLQIKNDIAQGMQWWTQAGHGSSGRVST